MTKNAQVTVPEIIDSVDATDMRRWLQCARRQKAICNLYPGAGRQNLLCRQPSAADQDASSA